MTSCATYAHNSDVTHALIYSRNNDVNARYSCDIYVKNNYNKILLTYCYLFLRLTRLKLSVFCVLYFIVLHL